MFVLNYRAKRTWKNSARKFCYICDDSLFTKLLQNAITAVVVMTNELCSGIPNVKREKNDSRKYVVIVDHLPFTVPII